MDPRSRNKHPNPAKKHILSSGDKTKHGNDDQEARNMALKQEYLSRVDMLILLEIRNSNQVAEPQNDLTCAHCCGEIASGGKRI